MPACTPRQGEREERRLVFDLQTAVAEDAGYRSTAEPQTDHAQVKR